MTEKLTKKELEELEKEQELFWKKVKYYFQEFFVLFMTFVGVVLSDAMAKRQSGEMATVKDVFWDWFNLVLSAVGALVCYGVTFTKFKYNDNAKPPLIKRGITAISLGIAWRTGLGWTNQG